MHKVHTFAKAIGKPSFCPAMFSASSSPQCSNMMCISHLFNEDHLAYLSVLPICSRTSRGAAAWESPRSYPDEILLTNDSTMERGKH